MPYILTLSLPVTLRCVVGGGKGVQGEEEGYKGRGRGIGEEWYWRRGYWRGIGGGGRCRGRKRVKRGSDVGGGGV